MGSKFFCLLKSLHIFIQCFVTLFSLYFIIACESNDTEIKKDPSPKSFNTVSISGIVTSAVKQENKIGLASTIIPAQETCNPIQSIYGLAGPISDERIQISIGGQTVLTDKNGGYTVQYLPIPTNKQLVITFSHLDNKYALFQRTITVAPNKNYSVSPVLDLITTNALIPQYGNVVVNDSDSKILLSLQFPIQMQGQNITTYFGDPTLNGYFTFPGDYLGVNTTKISKEKKNSSLVSLVGIVFTEIKVENFGQLPAPAVVKLRLPEKYQNGTFVNPITQKAYQDGDTIPWWSYNETEALWEREDAYPNNSNKFDAEVLLADGLLYAVAEITHLSYWSAAVPIERSLLNVKVVDTNNNPIPNIEIIAKGVSYTNTSKPVYTDSTGWARNIVVKRTIDSLRRQEETVQVIARLGSVNFIYDVTDANEGDVTNDYVFTPSIPENQSSISLTNTIQIALLGKIIGQILYQGTTLPVANQKVYTSFGGVAETNSNGEYEINVPIGADFYLFVLGVDSRLVRVDDTTPIEVNFEIPNRAPVITTFTRNPIGTVLPGTIVNFYVTAVDPDNDPINFEWLYNNVPSREEFVSGQYVWTAPAGNGNATITVKANDNQGNTTSKEMMIPWSDGTTSTSLKMTFTDNQGQPIPNVYAMLYLNDNKTIERYIQSDANGVANFGNIGRDHATFGWAYSFIDALGRTNRGIAIAVESRVGEARVALPYNPAAATKSINVTLNNVPATSNNSILFPFKLVKTFPSAINTFSSVLVTPQHLQKDSKLTLFAGTLNLLTPQKYGFLIDQNINSKLDFSIAMDRIPSAIAWTCSQPVDSVSITGVRKRVKDYIIGGWKGSAQNSGNAYYFNTFPTDYTILASGINSSLSGVTKCFANRKYLSTLPSNVVLPSPPDYNFTSFIYDPSLKKFSWALTGNTERDAHCLVFSRTGGGIGLMWQVLIPPTKSSWELPQIPFEIENWLDTTQLFNYKEIQVENWDIFPGSSGYEDLIQAYINSQDPELISNDHDIGYLTIQSYP